MRAPFQVLVIPFRRTKTGLEFAVLKRSDADHWQFIAGGGEDDETPLQAAQRETREEAGLTGDLVRLDTVNSVPKTEFAAHVHWDKDLYVVPEYCFALEVRDKDIQLSHEHTGVRWLDYKQAAALLQFDSNRIAMWELGERLKQ